MKGSFILRNRLRHRVRENSLIRGLRRRFQDDRLVLYFHMYERTWVVGTWMDKQHRFIQEHIAVPDLSTKSVREIVDTLTLQRCPMARQGIKECCDALKTSEHDEDRRLHEEYQEEVSLMDFMRRRYSKPNQVDNPDWGMASMVW